ncbi:MAG: hypothetical protein N3G79_02430 [Sulfolobales archaeon]|nr:hypothetical protein [Sulfolobales archaeon]
MNASEVTAKIQCFGGIWVGAEGVRLLLYRLERSYEVPLALPRAVNRCSRVPRSAEELVETYEYVRKALDIGRLKSICDLVYVEVPCELLELSYLASSRRVRCLPLSPKPDVVRSVEVLLKGSETSPVEVDVLQHSILAKRSRQIEVELYTACLVGEVLSPDIVAVGLDLRNYGTRVVTVSELKQTSMAEKPRRRKSRRKKKRKLKK